MRSATVAALVAVALAAAGCSDGVRLTVTESAGPPATPTPTQTQTQTPTPTATPDSDTETTADLDGDGTPDVVRIVTDHQGPGGDQRWGVRAEMSRAGTQTVWDECCSNDAQTIGPVADLGDDGADEVTVGVGTTATAGFWDIFTLHEGRLVRAGEAAALVTGWNDGYINSWACAEGGGLVVTRMPFDAAKAVTAPTGTRTYYRVDGDRLVHTRVVTDDWTDGQRPPEYDAFGC